MTSKHLTDSDWQQIAVRYLNGETSTLLAHEWKVATTTIQHKIKQMGFKLRPVGHSSRKYTVAHEDYFDQIDTPEKAYWLGLMGSDGCVSSQHDRFEVGLSGQEDRCVLEQFKAALGYTGPIRVKQPSHPGSKLHHTLGISSKRLVAGLMKHGICPRKSLVYAFNGTLRPDLIRHYVRGYFDGDGCASHKKTGDFLVGVVGSKRFIEELAAYLPAAIGLTPHVEKLKPSQNPATGSLKIGGTQVSFIFLDWIYRDATVYLPRKEAKYRTCREILRNNLSHLERLYSLRCNDKVMLNTKRCAELLGIDLKLKEWNGLSVSREDQDKIVAAYQKGDSVLHIRQMNGYSNTLVRNVLKRNGLKTRGISEQAILNHQLKTAA